MTVYLVLDHWTYDGEVVAAFRSYESAKDYIALRPDEQRHYFTVKLIEVES